MANEFNFGNVSSSVRAPYAAEESALQGLNEPTATAVAAGAELADQTANTFAIADEAEYYRVLEYASNNLFGIEVTGGAAVVAQGNEPCVLLAREKFGQGSDFVARRTLGLDLTDDDTGLVTDGLINANSSGEIHNLLQARVPGYQYFDWGNKTVPADVKESFGYLKGYQKLSIIEKCPAQTDVTGSVWTCTNQTAADQIVAEYIGRLKKVK